ncbi:hypothetical protein ZTR_06363 [Talaromyces verruculosus]|nr:hypothetical protein ZTR_06363 [Talaromyces verruculosus]
MVRFSSRHSRIKDLNKRRVRPNQSSAPQTPFSFGDTSGAAAAPSGSTASNGFSFGQSQSFPAPSASGATQNGSQSLSFSAGAPPSFNFGGFGATPASNPFTNLNGGNTQTQTQTQTQASNIFGPQSSTQAAQPSGQGIFGQSSNTSFQTQPASTGANPFAQSTATTPASPSLFQTQPASTGSSLFGQTKPASTGTNLFGQASSAAPASTPAAATTAPGSLFGQQSTSAAPSAPLFQSKPATTMGSTLFGQNPPATTTGTTNMFGQSVGASSTGGATSATATSGPTSLFGQGAPATGSPLFQPKPATTGTTNMFGQTAAASSPGASLFGQSVAAPSTPNKASTSLFGNAPATSASNTFNFGQTTSTTQKPLFNVASDTDDMSTSPDGKRKVSEQPSAPLNIFGQKPAQTPGPSEISRPTSSLFGAPTPSATANPPSPNLSTSSNIFGQQQSRSVSPAPNGVTTAASSVFAPTTTTSTASNPFGSLFAASPNKPATTPAPAASTSTAAPAQSLFATTSKSATTTAPAPATAAPAATSTTQSLFAGGAQPAQAKPLFTPQPSPDKRLGGATMDQAISKKAAGAVQGPAEEFLESDKRAEIVDLNRGFKEHLASYDPETQSLDSIIIFYIKMRKAIGAPVGSLTNKPGKRKLDDTHGIESPVQRPTAKKSKAQEATPEPELPSVRPSSAGKRKSSEDLDDSPNGKRMAQPYVRPTTQVAGKSETASIFASSFSAPKAAAPAASTSSSSANLFGFGSGASAAKETPRAASPQKEEPPAKPAFEVPKFGNVNFAGQFAKDSFQPSSAAPKVKLDLPKFNVSGQSFLNQFGQKAKGDDDDDTDEDSDSEAEPVVEKKVEKPSSTQPQSNLFSGSVFDSKPGTPSIRTNNIFGHLNTSTATSDAGESSDDDLTEQLQKRTKKSQPDAETEPKAEPKATSSLFGRITRPDGTPVNLSSDEEKAETPKAKPLFGQSTSSTFPAVPNNTPLFSSTSTPKTSSNIFGGSSTPSTTFNLFSSSLNPAAQLLAKEGTATASVTSDSNAEESDTETVKDTQLNLLTNAGEEDEDCIYEVRSKGLKLVEKTADNGNTQKIWETQGLGPLRVLVNRETKRARLLLRADPSGKAVLNTSISRQIEYKVQSGSCTFLVPRANGSGMDLWSLRFKKDFTAEVENAVKTAKEGLP